MFGLELSNKVIEIGIGFKVAQIFIAFGRDDGSRARDDLHYRGAERVTKRRHNVLELRLDRLKSGC